MPHAIWTRNGTLRHLSSSKGGRVKNSVDYELLDTDAPAKGHVPAYINAHESDQMQSQTATVIRLLQLHHLDSDCHNIMISEDSKTLDANGSTLVIKKSRFFELFGVMLGIEDYKSYQLASYNRDITHFQATGRFARLTDEFMTHLVLSSTWTTRKRSSLSKRVASRF